jgi:hypothetical protein
MAVELLLGGFWELVQPFIPVAKAKPKGGPSRASRSRFRPRPWGTALATLLGAQSSA